MENDNKPWLVFGGVVSLAFIGVIIWVLLQNGHLLSSNSVVREPASRTFDSGELVEVPALSDATIHNTDPVLHYSVDVHYPKLALVGHPDLAKDANAVIEGFVQDAIEDFKTNVNEINTTTLPKEMESDYTMRYTPLLLSPTIISLRFDYSEYTAGAAHPNNMARVLNYDLKRHLLLSTADLFASTTAALPFLSTYTRVVLKDMMSSEPKEIFDQQTMPGTLPTHENFQEVALTKKGLLIIFNPYQVAPYARGTILVPIPVSDTRGILADASDEAIRLASSNIVESTPENVATGTPK